MIFGRDGQYGPARIYSRAQLPVNTNQALVSRPGCEGVQPGACEYDRPGWVLRGFDLGLDNNEGTVTFETTADEAAGVASDNSSASNVDGFRMVLSGCLSRRIYRTGFPSM